MDIEISVTITAPDGTAHTDKIGAFSKGFDSAGSYARKLVTLDQAAF